MNASNPHYFLAVPLPDHVRRALGWWAEQLQARLPFKQWPHPQDYHITLAFLGASGFKQINQLKKEIGTVIQNHSSFPLSLDVPGTFGRSGQPSVLWAGVSSDGALYSLQRDIHKACQSAGFELDKRPYKPHITLAKRWMSQVGLDENELDKIVQPDDKKVGWNARDIVLYQIHPKRVPKYQPLKIFSLD